MNENGVRHGFIAGMVTIAFFTIFYMVDKRTMLGIGIYWSTILIYLVAMSKAVIDQRTEQGDIISFKEGLKTAFITFLVANVIYWVYYYILFALVDPGLIEIQREMAINAIAEAGDFFGAEATERKIEETIEHYETADMQVTASQLVAGYTAGAIGGFLLSLIVAVFLKRE